MKASSKIPFALGLAMMAAAIYPLSIRRTLAHDGVSVNIDAHISVHDHVEPPRIPVPPVVVVRPAGELVCTGSLRYQCGSGPWCSHVHGNASIELPLRVRVAETPCRLSIPEVGTFEVGAHTCFTINRTASRHFSLIMETGSVRYSIVEDAWLRVASPFEGIGAWCVGDVRIPVPSHRCTGRIMVDAEEGFQIYNLAGRVAYERGGHTIREVTGGAGLHVRLADGIDFRASAALPLERALLFEDYTRDLGWDEVEVYRKGHASGRGKSEIKESKKSVVVFDAEDTHKNQRGKGHEEHGNGKGLGHYKIKENKGKGRGGH